jgi:hypothetical protein
MAELAEKYERLLAAKDMEIAQLSEENIFCIKYMITLQDDLRRAGLKPSQDMFAIKAAIKAERRKLWL